MKLLEKENVVLNIIKYSPIFFVVLLSIITQIFISQKKEILIQDKIQLETQYIALNQQKVKSLVTRLNSFIEDEKENALSELKEKLKHKVYEAHQIAHNIYNYEKNLSLNKPLNKDKVIRDINNALSALSFNNNRGYIVIQDSDGKLLLHKVKAFEGVNFYKKNPKKFVFAEKIRNLSSTNPEVYISYNWYKNDTNKEYKKVGFYKYFAPLDIAIGAGDYIDDFENDVKKRVLKKINNIKFENLEHVFIYDLEGLCLVNPKKELVGKNRYNEKNKDGRYQVRDLLEFTQKHKEGFLQYESGVQLNEKLHSNNKISFVKLNEKWSWMIGSGFYLEALYSEIDKKEKELELSNKEVIKHILSVSIILTLIFIFISFYFSKIISKKFEKYKKNIEIEIDKTIEKEKLLLQQSKMATMGEMIGSIAHQWKQPLNLISLSNGVLRLVKEEDGIISEKQHSEALGNIDNAVINLSDTIDDFRNFFNPNKARDFFKVATAVDETLKLIAPELKNNNIKIIKNIEDIEIYGSQNELQQTLINLLKNAKEELIKKSHDEDRFIFIDIVTIKNKVVIKIKDNANGIDIKIINKIFNSYFTTKEKSGGTGIGLYMCKQIIEESMHGKISVLNVHYHYENKEYTGAEFTLVCPINYKTELEDHER